MLSRKTLQMSTTNRAGRPVFSRALAAVAVLALAAAMSPVHAEDNDAEAALNSAAVATPDSDVPHILVTPPPRQLSDEELALALNYDPVKLTGKARYRSPLAPDPHAVWEGGRQDDGSTRVSVKKSLAPAWDLRAGADLTVPGERPVTYRPDRPLPGAPPANTAQGGLWASAAVPDVADVSVRVDPGLAQNKFGADLKRTVPLGSRYSVTLENKVSVTDTTGLVAVAPGTAPQVWDSERNVKLNVKTTGTSFGVGTATSSYDGVTHHNFSAEQRVYGPLHVTGTLTDPGRVTAAQSIGAKFKLNW